MLSQSNCFHWRKHKLSVSVIRFYKKSTIYKYIFVVLDIVSNSFKRFFNIYQSKSRDIFMHLQIVYCSSFSIYTKCTNIGFMQKIHCPAITIYYLCSVEATNCINKRVVKHTHTNTNTNHIHLFSFRLSKCMYCTYMLWNM